MVNYATLRTYGAIRPEDAELLAFGLIKAIQKFPKINLVEVGVEGGETARGMHDFLGAHPHEYWGVDSNRNVGMQGAFNGTPRFDDPVKELEANPPFPGANVIVGDSVEVYDSVPNDIHFLFLDGCHCANHVILDFILYEKRVVPGGFLAFHDTSPHHQGTYYQGHGPETYAFHTAVRMGLSYILPLLNDWTLIGETAPPWGGIMLFQKGEDNGST